MDELDIQKLTEQASRRVTPTMTASDSGWSRNPPEKRVQINREELDIMEEHLTAKLSLAGDATEIKFAPQGRPETPSEAVPGAGGYKLDGGKARWELAPFDAFEAMVNVLTWAVDKKTRGDRAYPERNWERGMAWSRVFGAMIRHAWKWWLGKMTGRSTVDEESGMSHMWHAFTCAGFLVTYESRGMTDFDDRPSNSTDNK